MLQVRKELPKYKCHKEVWALKISEYKVIDSDGTVLITPEDDEFSPFKTDIGWERKIKSKNGDPGYYVVYEDGYSSWSPTKAFEEGYAKILQPTNSSPLPNKAQG